MSYGHSSSHIEQSVSLHEVEGSVFRRLEYRDEVSFDATISNNNMTGVSSFGFSGNGNIYKFSFVSGRIVDPNDNFISSYGKDQKVQISGNLNKNNHSYYVDKKPFQLSGVKADYNVERFFADSQNVNVNLNLYVYGNGPGGLSLSFDEAIDDGKVVDMTINNTGNGVSFDVFTGHFHEPYRKQITILNFPSGVSSSSKFKVSGSGSFPIDLNPAVTLFTTFGEVYISGVRVERGESKQNITAVGGINNIETFNLLGGEQ